MFMIMEYIYKVGDCYGVIIVCGWEVGVNSFGFKVWFLFFWVVWDKLYVFVFCSFCLFRIFVVGEYKVEG